MSSTEYHCEESIRLFGNAYEEVHQWLDEFAGSEEYGYKHRRIRHHEKGIDYIRQFWSHEAAAVARQHIISDLKEEGWTESDHFPKDEKDYVEMGLF